MQMLYAMLRKKALVSRYYLEGLVFPDTTAHQALKLSANGQDVGGEMLFWFLTSGRSQHQQSSVTFIEEKSSMLERKHAEEKAP